MSGDRPIVVCGAGAAGIGAAVAAARAGRTVFLLEERLRLGGTVTHALIHTIGGLFDSAGDYLNPGIPRELAATLLAADASTALRKMGRLWVLSVCPTVYETAVNGLIGKETRIRIVTGVRLAHVAVSERRIQSLRVASPRGESFEISPHAVVDATGTAEVARLIDGGGSGSAWRGGDAAAGGLIFRLRGVAPGTMRFPRNVEIVRDIHAAAASGHLPANCAQAWLDRGVRDDEVYGKLLVAMPPADAEDGDASTLDRARAEQAAVIAYLKRRPEFARARIDAEGCLGRRDGGEVVGRYELTAHDVRTAAKFADAACRCSWPIEFWDPQGGVSLEYLPDAAYYEIPYGSLRARSLDNLWTAGRSLYADAKARASARIAGACIAMGEAVGLAAAHA